MLQAWGEQGLDAFLRKLQRQYGEMAALAHQQSVKQLSGLAEWHAVQVSRLRCDGSPAGASGWQRASRLAAPLLPCSAQGGMFMWYKLLGVQDADEVTDALLEQRVVVTPGKAFWTRRDEPGAAGCPYIRLCFVYVGREELVEGIARLRAVLLQSSGTAGAGQ
jgi:hypothetical protein